MPHLHPTNDYNVLYSLHKWLRDALEAYERPAWISTFYVVEGVPEEEAPLPAVSIFDLPGNQSSPYQGRAAEENVAVMKSYGMLDASCWASRGALWNGAEVWRMQLNTLSSWVKDAVRKSPTVIIYDALADYNNPVATPYKINVTAANTVQAAADLNPDIMRQRVLIPYNWHGRADTG